MGELKELFTELMGWENNKVMRTLKGLTVSPGKTIQYFADGNRDSYVHALSYFLGVVGLISFLIIYLPESNTYNELYEYTKVERHEKLAKLEIGSEAYKNLEQNLNQQELFYKYIQDRKNTSFLMYCYVFIYSLVHLLIFKNLNKGLKYNVWFVLYIFAHSSLISFILCLPGYAITNISLYLCLNLIAFFISLVYWIWSSKQFYSISWSRAIKKNIYINLAMMLLPVFAGFFVGLYESYLSHQH